jgi:hypothetical protein
MPDLTPAQFAEYIADFVQRRIAQQPARGYQVTRTGPDGKQRPEVLTLPQAVAELTDALHKYTVQYEGLVAAVNDLKAIMEKNVRVGHRILRRYKQQKQDDDEDEDDT